VSAWVILHRRQHEPLTQRQHAELGSRNTPALWRGISHREISIERGIGAKLAAGWQRCPICGGYTGVPNLNRALCGTAIRSLNIEQIARAEKSGYGSGRALSGHNSDRPAASARPECAVCDGVSHYGRLREWLEERSCESAELLPSASRSRQSDQSSARRAAFRLGRESACNRGDNHDFALAKYCHHSWVLAARPSPFVSTSLFPSDLSLP
jgi:hypothetical protein